MEELGIPDLTTEQIEILCTTAESTARKYILSKIPAKKIEKLAISVEADGTKPLNLVVEIEFSLSPKTKEFDAEIIVNKAIKEALNASEKYLRNFL